MSDAAPNSMDVDAFLVWSEGEEGRFELDDGAVVAMAPERSAHLLAKAACYVALLEAIRKSGLACTPYPDGATVRITKRSAFNPDALVRCGPPLPPDQVEIPDPIIVLEVLSASTAGIDHGVKLRGYFTLPSIIHYVIVNPEQRMVIHHKRGVGDALETRILSQGLIKLDPPGLEILAENLFGLQ